MEALDLELRSGSEKGNDEPQRFRIEISMALHPGREGYLRLQEKEAQ